MADETCTIRVSSGQLFGSFASREDAWAAVERIRKSEHSDAVRGAAVVPLLAGVEPKPLYQRWLSDANEAQAGADQRSILAAVDTLIGAYNDARSLRRGYRYVSGYLLTSDPDLGEAVRVLVAPLHREVERLTEDSKMFNAVMWAIAGALGDAAPGAEGVEGDPVEMTQRLIATLERRTVQLDNARADADAARAELEQAHGLIYELRAVVSGRQGDIS